jgi:hypothetical protein
MLKSSLNIPVQGIAIGNGWIDGKNQYPAYFDYAVKHGLIEEGSDVRACIIIIRSRIFLATYFNIAIQRRSKTNPGMFTRHCLTYRG